MTYSPACCGTKHPSSLGITAYFPEEVMLKRRPKVEVEVGRAATHQEHCKSKGWKVRDE